MSRKPRYGRAFAGRPPLSSAPRSSSAADLYELTPTSPGGARPWERVSPPILFAGFGSVAGPACLDEDRHDDDR
jgi:hypothetical protein